MNHGSTRGRALVGLLVLAGLLATVAAAMYGWHALNLFSRSPLHVTTKAETIEIPPGTSFKRIIDDLRQRGVSDANPWYWRLLAERMRVAGRLHAGEYALSVGITPRQLLLNMANGKVLQHDFTIVDGWTFAELRQALAKATKLKHDSVGLDAATIMQKIGAPGVMPEGWFLPETYAYVKGDSDLDILKRAHRAMVKTLDAMWPGRDKNLPLATPYDALILASIVEKETGRADERARIAGVFIRRLQMHMLLQTDPSVIYGMGARYTGNITKRDLTTDTPYNTYTRPGLPPTPIALPGKPALEAALHPAPGKALYFVSMGNGRHIFADTLEEQNRNVNCYQRKHCG
ncbi:MAG: endolytic transglycosylase MltG [Rhodanobacter sp.]|nr:MAG: endolytic transglycosylase MltG [Rhodanobacter sp.]